MASPTSAQPLAVIDAVVLDTETTGLDIGKARFVQIGAVRLKQGRLLAGARFDALVNPQEPIPAVATDVHGLDEIGRAHV